MTDVTFKKGDRVTVIWCGLPVHCTSVAAANVYTLKLATPFPHTTFGLDGRSGRKHGRAFDTSIHGPHVRITQDGDEEHVERYQIVQRLRTTRWSTLSTVELRAVDAIARNASGGSA